MLQKYYMNKILEIELKISSNFLHSQYVSENVIKIWDDFGANFWKKPWAIVQGFFKI